ncbi:GNAT family N-acetyltransferase [Flagellimonas algicola]|uniref:GNAT family N-acetyltransferase n=1 Tax=Flagellimonas algicola TaxID=2583815 RepID=A0ABY2WJQ0_9FLAO|nr:GNAT family N-acetyltransferase [Allomuricauda algicola]TMU55060.1 GNAT family N-acetyltransferase [Allomuricauda algicola]
MGVELEVLEISNKNYTILESFIESLDDEKNSFRYFNKRGKEVLNNHLCTLLLRKDNETMGYGHLDKENDTIWLGIVVKSSFQGLGLGKRIIQILLDKATQLGVGAIQLSVDNDNFKAIKLYKGFGFKLILQENTYSIFRIDINANSFANTIGVSTLAFGKNSREEIVSISREEELTIEFSSSFPFQSDMGEFFVNCDIKRLAHNYFPAPSEPFVLNLGSSNAEIRERSILHCISGLRLSKKAGAPCFSAHAGFCVDPQPDQLGKKLNIDVPVNREENWSHFINSVKIVLDEAERLGLSFYVENNVTASFNLRNDGIEMLLCSRPQEMVRLFEEINSESFGLLLDTAHLKVSANALNFELNNAVEKVKPYVRYIHHSDNDGNRDTNESIDDSYWFLPWLKHFPDCIHVLEVKNITLNQINKQLGLLRTYGKQ